MTSIGPRGIVRAVGCALPIFLFTWCADAAELRRLSDVPASLPALRAPSADLAATLPAALGLDAESSFRVRATRVLPNRKGQTVRLDQTYRGVPIWNQQVIVQVSPANEVVRVRGTAVFDIGATASPSTPTLSAADVLARMKNTAAAQSAPPYRLTFRNEESRLYYYLTGHNELRLVYRVTFYTDLRDARGNPRPTRPVYFVDAHTGAVLDSYDNIQHAALGTGPGGNQKVGQWTWGSDAAHPKFQVLNSSGTCTLDDGVTVFSEDLNHAVDPSGGEAGTKTPFAFPCFNNTYQTINGGYSPLNDAHSFGYALYRMYKLWFGFAPISQKLWLRVHYGTGYENAFWNGDSMAFGDGASTFYPLVGVDVLGHEVSHGFTEQNSGLVYARQSGGMNESFSDMAGEALEYYYVHTYGKIFATRTMPDFLVGADIFKASGQALRYMCDPPADGISIARARDFYYPLNVHYTSGVYNKAFCLLAKTAGWDARKAFTLFVTANRNYWGPNETYRTAFEGVLMAADALGYPADDVEAAFEAVGVGPLPYAETNDNFQNATVLKAGWSSAGGSNASATAQTGEPTLPNGGGKTVWWKCVATTTGNATIDTMGSNIDTSLGVYTGSAVNALAQVVSNGDISGSNYASSVAFSATAGTIYFVAVDGYNYNTGADSGEIRLNLTNLRCAGDRSDFNNDSRGDILWRNSSGALALSLFTGTTLQTANVAGGLVAPWTIAAVGDFDGDGKADILWHYTAADNATDGRIWFMNGAQRKSQVLVNMLSGKAWQVLGAADFDGDGKADILWRNKATGAVVLWVMDGGTVKSTHNVHPLATAWTFGAIGDVNGDGKADVVWRHSSGATLAWLMDGGKIQSSVSLGTQPASWKLVGIGDLNNDGTGDLVFHNDAADTLLFWLTRPNLTHVALSRAGRKNSAVAGVRDIDGDGKADVLWRDTAGALVLWEMNAAQIKASRQLPTKPTTWQIQP